VRAQQECCLGFVVPILEEGRCEVLVGLLDSRFSSAQPPGWSSPLNSYVDIIDQGLSKWINVSIQVVPLSPAPGSSPPLPPTACLLVLLPR
jgi:hypothetical protein